MGRRLGRVVVGLTLTLISFISYSSQIFVIWPWYGREVSVPLLNLLLPFNILIGLLFWNYWLCVLTDPGQVPMSWKPDVDSGEGYEVKPLTGAPRFCRTCNRHKPPRSHHCRQCQRCVLRMDHHCPWVNNCIGHYNYGHFIRFLFFVDVACSYHLAMVTARVYDGINGGYWNDPSGIDLIFIVLNYVTCVPVLLSVGAFSLYHFYCLMGNTTTIEGWEKDKAATLFRHGKIQEIKFPYNLGAKRNIASILGPNPLMWCCPTVTPGSGLRYDIADGSGTPVWPPRDPAEYNADGVRREFSLPDSPWTYENGALNPDLVPYKSTVRQRTVKSSTVSALPPYHPDYEDPSEDHHGLDDDEVYEEDSDIEEHVPAFRVRRGSEGYEVRTVDREAMLQHYVQDQIEQAGRYKRYVPEDMSESDPDEDEDDTSADGRPVDVSLSSN